MTTKIVERVSCFYACRVWWIDQRDLKQEAWLTVLTCDRPEFTDEHYRRYTYRAVSKSLSRYCWEQSSIVSTHHAGKQLAGIHRVPLEDATLVDPTNPEMELLKKEAAMLVPYLREKLRQRLTQLVGADAPCVEEAILVLVEGEKPRDVADRTGVKKAQLYNCTKWMKKQAMADPAVRNILFNIERRRGDL